MELSTELLGLLVTAAKNGNYAYATALALVVCVALVRRYGVGRIAWLGTDAGGAALALAGSMGAAMTTALATGSLSWSLVWAAIGVAVTAAGGYSLIKRLIVTPIIKPLASKAPAWAQPIFTLLLYLFESRVDAAARVTQAGDEAVAAKPAQGIANVAPDNHDIN